MSIKPVCLINGATNPTAFFACINELYQEGTTFTYYCHDEKVTHVGRQYDYTPQTPDLEEYHYAYLIHPQGIKQRYSAGVLLDKPS